MNPRHLVRIAPIFLFTLALFGCAEARYANVDNDQLKQLIAAGTPVIDIRTPREWAQTGVVPGSHRITFFQENGAVNPNFLPELQQIVKSPDQPVAVICRTGNRTQALARILSEEKGYTQVSNVSGGITKWISAGNPTEK